MAIKSFREQVAGTCVHFNGLMNAACAAGCVYDDVDDGRRITYRRALPCLRLDESDRQFLAAKGVEQATCELLRLPTDEELDAREREECASAERLRRALEVVAPIRKEHKGKNWSGVLECPNCKGRLSVRHAACNGHIHAMCETDGCVGWCE